MNLQENVSVILDWYQRNKRDLPWRKDIDPYHIWISEIMLQQTRVEAVKEYYTRFLGQLPTIYDLANCNEEKLLKLWEGLGYYTRVRNLQKAAKIIVDKYEGIFPVEYDQVKSLPGIGDYTAGAICSICYNQKTPAVDGNVLRVFSRVLNEHRNITDPKVRIEITNAVKTLYSDDISCGDLTQGLIEIGATVCIPNGTPKCNDCPMKEYCLAHQRNTAIDLPVKEKKGTRKVEKRTIFLLECNGKFAIQKRPEKGLLASLWEFPNIEGYFTIEEMESIIKNWDLVIEMIKPMNMKTHIFSHITWEMKSVLVKCKNMNTLFQWKTKEDLTMNYSLPVAFQKVFEE